MARVSSSLGLVLEKPRAGCGFSVLQDGRLNEQTLAERPRSNADWILRLRHAQRGLDQSGVHGKLVGHIVDLDAEIVLVVERTDMVLGNRQIPFRKRRGHIWQGLLGEPLLRRHATRVIRSNASSSEPRAVSSSRVDE
jgi:hypothetical protein